MCGINGILSSSGVDGLQHKIKAMNRILEHRGPDDQGLWISDCKRVTFGHTRLSIIDTSSSGHQPMSSSSGRYVITYNGEIYNFRELQKSYNIKCLGNSDTEVLLELIQKIGLKETLKVIDGMFAFALWDKQKQTLNICRDRFGEKPIYYGWIGNNFTFSSQLDCLKIIPGWTEEISWQALNQFQNTGYVSSPQSIYKGIKKLSPSSNLTLKFKDKHTVEEHIECFWDISKIREEVQSPMTLEDYLEEFDILIKESVTNRMISDVPLGAFLSGGTDSSLVVATMQALSSSKINTFTIGINDKNYNEAPKAKAIAAHLGTNHTELYIDQKEILELAPSIHANFDEPFSDSSQIPSYLISKLAKQSVTVALSGDAGDEFFGGYKRYLTARDLWRYSAKLPNFTRSHISRVLNNKFIKHGITDYSPEFLLKKYSNSSNRLNKVTRLANLLSSEDISSFYSALTSNTNSRNFLNKDIENNYPYAFHKDNEMLMRLMKKDIDDYLPNDVLTKVDRTSMSHSLEVRVPLLSKELAEWSLRLPMVYKINKNQQKIFLKKYLEKYLDKKVIYGEKKGFSIPMNDWLKGPLQEWAEDILSSDDFRNSEYWNTKKVNTAWKNHKNGLIDSSSLIWSVLNFQCWKES